MSSNILYNKFCILFNLNLIVNIIFIQKIKSVGLCKYNNKYVCQRNLETDKKQQNLKKLEIY